VHRKLVSLLAVASGVLVGATAASASPIVIATSHGGLCFPRHECRSVGRIDDTTISAAGFRPRRLTSSERAALLAAIGRLDLQELRAHPFRGMCPTASDGTETIYRFRGFPQVVASCTYNLRGVRAVQLEKRLARSLRRLQAG